MSAAGQIVLNAVILIPTAANVVDSIYLQQCLNHVEARGYRLIAVLYAWSQVIEMFGTREAQVVVLARREHLDPEWFPRIEFAAGAPDMDGKRRHRNRPQIVS